jgi:predicted transcriptional regulator
VKREEWTGEVAKQMHIYNISGEDLAREMGCTRSYVCRILTGSRDPRGGRERVEAALERCMARRAAG